MDQEPTDNTAQAMPFDPPNDELEALLERLCAGELDPVGWRRIGELIKGDRIAAKRYADTVHYCEALREETGGAEPPSTPLAMTMLQTQPEETLPTTDLSTSERVNEPQRWSWVPLLGIAVGLAFLAGWGASQLQPPESSGSSSEVVSLSGGSLGESIGGASEPGSGAPTVDDDWLPSEGPDPLMRITALSPDASADGLIRSMPVGAQLRRGEVVQLTVGAARLSLADGEVIVEGPAEFSAIDPQTVFVRRGSVTAKSTKQIAIHTSLALVTCERGSVGVISKGDNQIVVCGIEGRSTVLRRPRRGDTATKLGEVPEGQTLRVAIKADRTPSISKEPGLAEGLLVDWDQTASRLNPYEQLVLSDTPLAYWPLNRIRRHRAVLDLTQHGFDGHAIGAWPTELIDADATQGRGSFFNGESYVESYRKPPVDLRSGFTIESWARVLSEPVYQSIFASRWVLESNTDREQCFGFTLYAGENEKWQFWTGSGAYGANWDQLHADATVSTGQWTHVVASFEPDSVQDGPLNQVTGEARVYVDGQLVGSAEHTLSLEDFEWPARIGAAEFVPKSLTSWLFRGELRDVALYDYVLPTPRIQVHAQKGKSAS